MTLSEHLVHLDPKAFEEATNSPFLRLAGSGKLDKKTLARWLSQDRIYGINYIRFAGLLLAKIRPPITISGPNDRRPLEWSIFNCFTFALTNVQRELGFFETVAKNYGLNLNEPYNEGSAFGPNAITHAYRDFFLSAAAPGTPLLQGMVAIWATEICYLTAWRNARAVTGTVREDTTDFKQDADGGALRIEFIDNWTNKEFQDFVDELCSLMNDLAKNIGEDELKECEETWRHALWLEKHFWPTVEE